MGGVTTTGSQTTGSPTTGSRTTGSRQLVHDNWFTTKWSLRFFYDMVIAAKREVLLMKITRHKSKTIVHGLAAKRNRGKERFLNEVALMKINACKN